MGIRAETKRRFDWFIVNVARLHMHLLLVLNISNPIYFRIAPFFLSFADVITVTAREYKIKIDRNPTK